MQSTHVSGCLLSLLLLAGCAPDPTNDPHSGGFFGGIRGLAAGDYEQRQQQLGERRDDSLTQLRTLREEGASLEAERQMKAEDVAEQRRKLAALKARNQALARQIAQLQESKSALTATTPMQRTTVLRQKQQQLTQNIQRFEKELNQGQLTTAQAEAKRLSLERQYDAIKDL
ncbi:MAG: hypothetical protein U1F42_04585 [Candidatus Competibacteraceae bacterium]